VDTIQIAAELVDVKDGSLLWGEQYRRKLTDVLAVQEEIAVRLTRSSSGTWAGRTGKFKRKRPSRATLLGHGFEPDAKGHSIYRQMSRQDCNEKRPSRERLLLERLQGMEPRWLWAKAPAEVKTIRWVPPPACLGPPSHPCHREMSSCSHWIEAAGDWERVYPMCAKIASKSPGLDDSNRVCLIRPDCRLARQHRPARRRS
jgi:hypothetical protein